MSRGPKLTDGLTKERLREDVHARRYGKENWRDLSLWLRGIESFFDLEMHPSVEAGGAGRSDLTNETRILHQALQKALHLAASCGQQLVRMGRERDAPLAESLSDLIVLCEHALGDRPVGVRHWQSLANLFMQHVFSSSAARDLFLIARQAEEDDLHPKLRVAIELCPEARLRDDLRHIFVALTRMSWWLQRIEAELQRDLPLKVTLPIFVLIHREARELISFIEGRALRTEGLGEQIFNTLDASAYALSMELKKVFAHELVGVIESREAPFIYARIEDATGLLTDCFQQTIVTIAQLFDGSINGASLFPSFHTRLEQSLKLRQDLWNLLQSVRSVERERHQLSINSLIERLEEFRRGSMRYLMYKDWESLERFIEEVSTAHGLSELVPVLHRFSVYLEALFGQVNMRLVLADHPFEFASSEAPLANARSGKDESR